MLTNKLKLNSEKTHLLLIKSDASRRLQPDLTVSLNTGSEIIHPSKNEKLLGGIISQNLKFTDHIMHHENSLLRILNQRLNALKLVCPFLSFKSRKQIAAGIFMSQLISLMPLWCGAEVYLIKALQVTQNKAARIVTSCDIYTPISKLLQQCGWLSVSQLGMYHSLMLVYKTLTTRYPVYLHQKLTFQPPEKHYKTRNIVNTHENELLIVSNS